MTWTQPLCDSCWDAWSAWEGQLRRPPELVEPELETCCLCGQETDAGIYVRVDPQVVPFPRAEPDDRPAG